MFIWFRKHQLLLSIVLIIGLSLPAFWALFHPGFFTNHDGEGHIIRLQEFHNALFDGQIPVRIAERLNWGYSYPFFNFNYPLVYFSGEIFHLLGFSFVSSIKLIFIVGFFLSGIFMYIWQRHWWGNLGGIFAALVYMYAPYRFSNIYVRGSVAEHLAFVFTPLIFHWATDIADKKRWRDALLGALFYGMLLLSHNISALIFSVFLILYAAFLILVKKNIGLVKYYLVVVFGGLLLSAFFLIPSFLEQKFTFLAQTIGKDYPDHFVFPHQLLTLGWGFGGSVAGPNDGMSFQIGLVQLAVFIFSLLYLSFLAREKFSKIYPVLFFGITIFVAIFLMFEPSRLLWDNLPLLPFVQFPWRFLSWITFAIAALSGSLVYFFLKYLNKLQATTLLFGSQLAFLSFLVLFLYLANFRYWHVNQYVEIQLPKGEAIEGTTTWADEQTPVWFDKKLQKIPSNRVEVLEGKADVFNIQWSSNRHTYNVFSYGDSKLADNTVFWPGWKVLINGGEVPIDYRLVESGGRIAYNLTPGMHEVEVRFSETQSRILANYLSLFTFLALLGGFIFLKVKKIEEK